MLGMRSGQKGILLITMFIVFIIIAGLCLTVLSNGIINSRNAELNKKKAIASALAEGACEYVEKLLLTSYANYEDEPRNSWVTINGISVPYKVKQVGDQWITYDDVGVQTIYIQYRVSATATSFGVRSTVSKLFNVKVTPIFQYLAFYEGDLEMLPGPNATFHGRIHSNGDIYLGCGATMTLDTDSLRAVGKIYRRRKDDPTLSEGTVRIKVKDALAYVRMDSKSQLPCPSESGMDSMFLGYEANGDGTFEYLPWIQAAFDLWNGTVLSGGHGIEEVKVPATAAIQPFLEIESGTGGDYTVDATTGEIVLLPPELRGTGNYRKGYYHKNADLVVKNGIAFDSDGNEIRWPSEIDDKREETTLNPLSESTFFDGRQETYVTVTDIDIRLLNKTEYYPENGLLYVYRTDSTEQQPNGVRLIHGEGLKDALTIVTKNPIYIGGDFNIGTAHYPDKKPAAVIADAVNLLSKNWDDANKVNDGDLPAASETTFNVAYITGNYDTIPNSLYNGGFENLPRFHENWSGITCNIRGSFVNIWKNTYAKGPWVYGSDNYTAPNRNWDYDSDFNNVDNLPPFTPRAVSSKSVFYERK